MSSKNSGTSQPHRLLLNLSDKINLTRSDEYVAFSNLSIYSTWKDIKKSYKNNKFKISAPTWNEGFQLTDGSYSVSHNQDYFDYIIKKYKTITNNPLIMLYAKKIEKTITFKIKTGYYIELVTTGKMKLLGSTKK